MPSDNKGNKGMSTGDSGDLDGLSISPSDSNHSLQSSIESSQYAGVQPHPYEEEVDEKLPLKERKLSSLSGTSFTSANDILQAMRRSLSRSSSADASRLSRYATTYSVKDIYGDMAPDDIRLRRTTTKSTILNQLSDRVQKVGTRAEDEESKGEQKVDKDGTSFYENQPDVSVPAKDFGGEFSSIDPELVTWDGEQDEFYPRNWSLGQKAFQTGITAIYTLVSPMSSSVPSSAMPEIAKDLGMHGNFIQSFSVSIMILAWAIGPLIIAPLSESDRVGRRPVLNISIWIIFVFNLACGFAKTPAQLCIFRFLGGLGGCAPLNVGAGTLSDLYSNDQRLVAMAFYSICPTLGPVLSPIISGFIVENASWHWVFWVLAIFNGVVAVFGTIFFKETYSPRLLKTKAQKLRKETGNEHLHTIYEIANGDTVWDQTVTSISRPIKLLFTHPMVIGLGSFMAFTYGFMYLMVVTFPDVWEGTYGFNTGISGLMFISMGIGYILGTIICTYIINWFYNYLTKRNGGVPKPEYRLPCLCISGIGLPIGLIWYGWSAQHHLPWIMPCIGAGIFAFVFIAVFQTIQNYLIDMNNRFAASSVAAAAVFRSLFGFAFPLFAKEMYDTLNYGWGNTLCAFIGLALGIPFPIFCLIYGERLRGWANRRMDREQARKDAKKFQRLQEQNLTKEDEAFLAESST
ncbi:uncharacterized protein PRCAT00003100001 [Priceomyces carsonii]|uniref:uncharacterized protein n=1 Tax=Priceomyces carsonii TaxID=28549 RepID=UPI002ED7F415|nr:unnamed protein product [Priceomyces carsonii]